MNRHPVLSNCITWALLVIASLSFFLLSTVVTRWLLRLFGFHVGWLLSLAVGVIVSFLSSSFFVFRDLMSVSDGSEVL
ncbi:MAG: hypothetical protein LKI88_03715 [Bifidobacterium sp.]|jgi:uncharacterized membrane protein required for colicin V production|nr:hypothetical protein [Bifidobacterium sp.]MCI1865027.1 hypothetical protein [Bifidobacterium sp.]